MIFGCILLILLSFSFAIALFWKKRFEQTLPLVCSLIILILYVFGLMGILVYGVYTLVALAVVCAVYIGFSFWHHPALRKQVFTSLITPGLVAFFVLVAIFYLMNIGRLLSEWDEFSHWGLVVKNMANFDVLGNAPGTTTYFLDYPPASALFLYFFQKFYPVFNESYLMIAQGILTVSFLLPVFAEISWKRWKALFLMLPLVILLPLAFYPLFFSTVYVDALLGVQFAYLLFVYFSQKEISGFLLFQLSIGSAVLCLTKPSGLGLAGIVLALIALDLIIHRRTEIKQFVSAYGPSIGHRITRILALLSPIWSLVLANFSWKARLAALGIGPHFDTGEITFSGLSELWQGTAPEYRYNTVDAFVRRVCGISEDGIAIHSGHTFLFWAILLIVAVVAFYFLCREVSAFRRMRTVCIGLVVSFALYAGYLLLLYLFTYSQTEAQNLASCSRYLYTFLLGCSLFIFFMFLHYGRSRLSTRPFYGLCAGCIALCIAIAPNTIYIPTNASEEKQETVEDRGRYLQAEKAASVLDPSTSSVYVISQDDPELGLDYFTLRYVMTPVQVQQRPEGKTWTDVSYSLGKPYREDDTQTRDITAEDWGRELAAMYTHVYVLHPDEQFITLYGSLFENPEEIADNTLFEVQKTEEGSVRLVLVPYEEMTSTP